MEVGKREEKERKRANTEKKIIKILLCAFALKFADPRFLTFSPFSLFAFLRWMYHVSRYRIP